MESNHKTYVLADSVERIDEILATADKSYEEVKEIPGVSGIHVMAYRQEEYVAEIVDESGVLRGRRPWKREAGRDELRVARRLDEILHEEAPRVQAEIVRTAHQQPDEATG